MVIHGEPGAACALEDVEKLCDVSPFVAAAAMDDNGGRPRVARRSIGVECQTGAVGHIGERTGRDVVAGRVSRYHP